jgi:hypothetical protein
MEPQMSTTSDYVASLVAELDAVTESMVENLITAKAVDHDAIAGQLRGMAKAKKLILEHAKKFQAAVDEDDIERFKPSRRQTAFNLRIS